MRRAFSVLVASLATIAAAEAQTRQPASITTIPSQTPAPVTILDSVGQWASLGTTDPGAHTFHGAFATLDLPIGANGSGNPTTGGWAIQTLPTGNALPTIVTLNVQDNSIARNPANPLRQYVVNFGLVSTTGGDAGGNSGGEWDNATLYAGIECMPHSHGCWAFNPLIGLYGAWPAQDFNNANAIESDFANSTGNDQGDYSGPWTPGQLCNGSTVTNGEGPSCYFGNVLIDGTGSSTIDYGLAITGTISPGRVVAGAAWALNDTVITLAQNAPIWLRPGSVLFDYTIQAAGSPQIAQVKSVSGKTLTLNAPAAIASQGASDEMWVYQYGTLASMNNRGVVVQSAIQHAFEDESNAQTSLYIYGWHDYGLDLSNATFSPGGAAIKAPGGFTLNPGGWLGINQPNPQYALDVVGATHFLGALSIDSPANLDGAQITWQNGGVNQWSMSEIFSDASKRMRLYDYQNDRELFALYPSGLVIIGDVHGGEINVPGLIMSTTLAGQETGHLGGDDNGAVVIGQQHAVAGSFTPYLDFHTGSSNADARLMATLNKLDLFVNGSDTVEWIPGTERVIGVINANYYQVNGTVGVNCSAPPTAAFRVVNGIVTQC